MLWFACYGLALLGLSAFFAMGQRKKAADTFFVNDRTSSSLAVGFSILASCVGGSATLGMTGLAWQVGTPALWWLCSGALGLCILALFLARRVRQSGARTLPQMVHTFVGGKSAARLSSVIILMAWLAITAAQFSALATLLHPFIGTSFPSFPHMGTLALGAVFIIFHAMGGGQRAVIKSDAFHYLFLMVIMGISLCFLLGDDSLSLPMSSLPLELVNDDFPLSKVSYFLLIMGGSYVVCPMLFGRLLSARSEETARRGALLGAAGLVLSAIVLVSIGVLSRGIVPEGTPPQGLLPTVFTTIMPPWLGIMGILALMSAVISSADSSLITAATIACNDVLQRTDVRTCRLCTLVLGLGSLALAVPGMGILELLLMANDIFVCGVVLPVCVAMLCYKRYTVSSTCITLAMLSGGLCGLFAAFMDSATLSYVGLALALALSLIGCKAKATAATT